jgi:hypothetical protein
MEYRNTSLTDVPYLVQFESEKIYCASCIHRNINTNIFPCSVCLAYSNYQRRPWQKKDLIDLVIELQKGEK